MKHDKVLVSLEIVSYIFICLSFIELFYMILLNFAKFKIDVNSVLLFEFMYFSDIISLSGTFLWLFLITSMVCFLIFGIFINRILIKKNIESKSLAKLMVVVGMIILLGAFVKMNYLVLLGKTKIASIYGSIRFQSALYDFDVTPIMPAVFWIFFVSVNCCYLITGLVVTTLGIKWTILIEQESSTDS